MSPSRQYESQLRQVAEGKCRRCGQPLNLYAQLCDGCMAKDRAKRGYRNAWEPGKPGRPPKGQERKPTKGDILRDALKPVGLTNLSIENYVNNNTKEQLLKALNEVLEEMKQEER